MSRVALSHLKIIFLKAKDALFPVPCLYSSVTGGNYSSEKCVYLDFNDIRWKVKKTLSRGTSGESETNQSGRF